MPVTPDNLQLCYDYAKAAYEKKLKNAEAVRAIGSKTSIPATSANTIVRNLGHLIQGERYTRRLSSPLTDFYLRSILQDYGSAGLRNALSALWAHIEYYETKSSTNSVTDRRIHQTYSVLLESQDIPDRLPVHVLERATPEYVWNAVQMLLHEDVKHGFDPSTDYDLIGDEGRLLAPKAVFGIALSLALGGKEVGPKNFSGGEASPCFRLLRAAGYQIVPKGGTYPVPDSDPDPDQEWYEGKRKLRTHLVRERAPGLAKAKKAHFKRSNNGMLKCERCHMDPIEEYNGIEQAEACIEVHHANIQVSRMPEGNRTRLEDLQCLCANCHRIVHRIMATENKN